MFELEILKKDSGLDLNQLARLEDLVRREFPDDEMMFELHLLRILDALKKDWITSDVIFAKTISAEKVVA
jgi:hypothetical protein